MADMIYTPDGKGHPLLDETGDSLLAIIAEYAGNDAATWYRIKLHELHELETDLRDEMRGYEESVEEYRRALIDTRDELEGFFAGYVTGRSPKRKTALFIAQIVNTINTQI